MKILAVDTATKSCSVAVTDNHILLAEVNLGREQTHSRHLIEMIDSAVFLSGLSLSDIDGFAVTRGPGSFTGLRIGISTVKGLAAANGKPVVGVSTLDSLAFRFSSSSYPVCVMLDARKNEVYFSVYRFDDGIMKKEGEEQVLPPGNVIEGITEPYLFAGDGAIGYKDVIKDRLNRKAMFVSGERNRIRASSVAEISLKRFDSQETDNISDLVPRYIRKSDAEINLNK